MSNSANTNQQLDRIVADDLNNMKDHVFIGLSRSELIHRAVENKDAMVAGCGAPIIKESGISYVNYIFKNQEIKAPILRNYGYDLNMLRNECQKEKDVWSAALKYNELKKTTYKKEENMNMDQYDLNSEENQHALNDVAVKHVYDSIKKLVDVKDILDVGCGISSFLSYAKEKGTKFVEGVEGRIEYVEMAPENVKNFIKNKDIRKDNLDDVDCHETVTSFEVIEHIPETFENNIITLLTSRCKKWLVMSAAVPGQAGTFHVNLKPQEYWINLIQSKGFIFRKDLTDQYKEDISKIKDVPFWYINNMMFFEKKKLDILVDNVHGALLKSNRMLFENRLEYNLYTMDQNWDGFLNYGSDRNMVSFEEFKNKKFDIIICSTPQNFYKMKELKNKYQNQAKLIMHAGNNYMMDWSGVDNALLSCAAAPDVKNKVTYHQEFDTKNEYNYMTYIPKKKNIILTFLYDSDHEEVKQIESLLPEFEFKYYGSKGRDKMELNDFAPTNPSQIHISKAMKNSMFIFHLKKEGDGYGHVIHNIFATGRVLVTRKSYFKNMMPEWLMEDEVTFLDIDNLTNEQISEKIRKWSEPKLYRQLSVNAKDRFRSVVNFDFEEIKLREFLVNLV